MGGGETACCTIRKGREVEGRREKGGGRMEGTGLHFRIFCLIGAVIRHCGRCSPLSAARETVRSQPLSTSFRAEVEAKS